MRQYIKENLDKSRFDFFVLSNITHYFVRHIDVYQVNNAGNINIHARYVNIPTTIKSVINGIIEAGVGNDTNGARNLFLYHCFAVPEVLYILERELNVLACRKCRRNIKVFLGKDDRSFLQRGCKKRGTFKRL